MIGLSDNLMIGLSDYLKIGLRKLPHSGLNSFYHPIIQSSNHPPVLLVRVTYSSSTFFRAHSVLRKNFKLELMDGLLLKQLTGTRFDNSSQPK